MPFANVMLALLFLVIGDPTPAVCLPRVALPGGFDTTAQTTALPDDAIRVLCPRIYPKAVREAIPDGGDRKVHLAVDARAKWPAAALAPTGRAKGAATLRP